MARKQIVVCDRCGKSARLGSESVRFKKLTFSQVENFGSTTMSTEKELCGRCVDDVLDTINQPPR